MWLFYGICTITLKSTVFLKFPFLIFPHEIIESDLFLILGRNRPVISEIGQTVIVFQVFSEINAELLGSGQIEMDACIICVFGEIYPDLF